VLLANAAQQRDAGVLRHRVVHDEAVVGGLGEQVEPLVRGRRAVDTEPVVFAVQQLRGDREELRVVVHVEYR
jgi:hypothetical protein